VEPVRLLFLQERDMKSEISDLIDKNIQALIDARAREENKRSRQEKIADWIGSFTGSIPFVYIHVALFGFWIVWNSSLIPHVPKWDPYPYVNLAMFASVEAIFLSTFVLINQNSMNRSSERRAELDLQISLLTEHEITKLAELVDDIRHHLGAPPSSPEIAEIKEKIPPEELMERIENASKTPGA
jgi:uncharacterized membrane protein